MGLALTEKRKKIELVRSLRLLALSPPPASEYDHSGEALSAMRKAFEIMERYQLTEADVQGWNELVKPQPTKQPTPAPENFAWFYQTGSSIHYAYSNGMRVTHTHGNIRIVFQVL